MRTQPQLTHTDTYIRYLLKNEVNVCCVRCSFFSLSFTVFVRSFAFTRWFGTKSRRIVIPHSGFMFVNKLSTNSVAFWIACASHTKFLTIRVIFFLWFRNFLREIIFIVRVYRHSLVSFRFNISDYKHITVRERKKAIATSNDFVSNSVIWDEKKKCNKN